MGYSIATRARSKKLLLNMWDFMQEHYTLPSDLFNQRDNYSRLAVNIFDDESSLSYDSSKLAIGFDYNACEPERDYIYLVVKWMALKIGKSYKIRNVGEVPYYVYDGYEKCPIFVESLWKDNIPEKYKWALVNDIGFESLSKKYVGVPAYENAPNKKKWVEKKLSIYSELIEMPWREVDNKIHDELKKLDSVYHI
jgi:hypothetical protein